jgi:hypothetical protein
LNDKPLDSSVAIGRFNTSLLSLIPGVFTAQQDLAFSFQHNVWHAETYDVNNKQTKSVAKIGT